MERKFKVGDKVTLSYGEFPASAYPDQYQEIVNNKKIFTIVSLITDNDFELDCGWIIRSKQCIPIKFMPKNYKGAV